MSAPRSQQPKRASWQDGRHTPTADVLSSAMLWGSDSLKSLDRGRVLQQALLRTARAQANFINVAKTTRGSTIGFTGTIRCAALSPIATITTFTCIAGAVAAVTAATSNFYATSARRLPNSTALAIRPSIETCLAYISDQGFIISGRRIIQSTAQPTSRAGLAVARQCPKR